MAAVLIAAGARLATISRLPLGGELRLAVHFLLGAGALTLLLTAAGLAGVLNREVAVGVVGGLALGGRWRRWRWPSWPLLLALAPPVLLLLPVALAPPFFYDALVYHLGLPWQALLEGGWRPHPENFYSTLPPLAQCVALPALAVGLERVPALLHLASFVIAGCGVAGIGLALGAPRWARAWGGALLLVLPNLAVVPAFPAAEGWGIAGISVGVGLVARRRLPPGSAWLVAALAGLAAASRAQVVPLSFALTLVACCRAPTVGQLGAAGLAAALSSFPWWGKNLVLLDAPLAPLGWAVGGQEALWRDGRVASALASSPAEGWRIVVGGIWPSAWFVLVLALLALVAVAGRPTAVRLWLAGMVGVGLGAWAVLAAVPRYLGATAALLLGVAAAAASRRGGRMGFALAAMAIAGHGAVATATLVAQLGGLRLVREDPFAVRARLVVNDPFPAFAEAGRLPAGARVLFVGEPRGYGFPRRFVAASYYDLCPLAPVVEQTGHSQEIATWLASQGFSHLLVNWGELQRLAPGYPVAPWRSEAGKGRFLAYLAWLGGPVLSRDGVEVWTVFPRGSAQGAEGEVESGVR